MIIDDVKREAERNGVSFGYEPGSYSTTLVLVATGDKAAALYPLIAALYRLAQDSELSA